MLIGQVFPQEREIELNAGKKTIQIEVTNIRVMIFANEL